MNKLATLAVGLMVAGGAALTAAAPVEAMGGCGPGFHPGPYGHHCFRNGGAAVVVAPGIGVFVGGHGYWDGNRYWGHRYRWHGGWRYR
jgi:hypothetical protein